MKKLGSILLALLLVLQMSAIVWAAEPAPAAEGGTDVATATEADAPAEEPEDYATVQDDGATQDDAVTQDIGNDDHVSATPLTLNKAYQGQSLTSGDVDWYKFTLAKRGKVSIQMNNAYDSANNGWTIKLYAGKANGDYDTSHLYNSNHRTTSQLYYSDDIGLPAGTYYIKLDPYYGIKDFNYSIKVNYTQTDDWEMERNDDHLSATPLTAGKKMNASTTGGDVDWFTFTLAKPGVVDFTFANDYKADGGWYLRIYPAKANGDLGNSFVDSYSLSAKTKSRHTPKQGLAAGTYYLKVDPHYGTYAINYSVTLNYTASSAWEREFNNSYADANAISLGKTIKGTIQSNGGDEDWYVLKLKSKQKVNIIFTNAYKDGGSYNLDIYKGTASKQGERVHYYYFNSKQKKHTQKGLTLPKGTYYFKVSSGYSVNGSTYSLTVTDPKKELRSFTLNSKKKTLNAGATFQLKVKSYTPKNTISDKTATWKSSKTKVATVDSKGKVTAVAPGKATITCTVAGIKTKCIVTVQIKPSAVSLSKNKLTLKKGKTATLVATVSPADASNKAVTWKSDKPTVVSVTSKGKVKALKRGTAIITATTKLGKKTAKCTIKVK